MKKIIISLIVICYTLIVYAQDYRDVDWKTIPTNIQLLGVDTFKFDADPIDYNDVGVGLKDSGYYFIDFIARAFLVIGYDATTITVVDLAHENTAPNEGQVGRVYQSIVDGDTLFHSIGGVDVSVIDELSRWKDVARNNELFGRALKNSSFKQPLDSLLFNRNAVTTGHNPYKVDVDTINGTLRMYNDEADIAMQMGQELWLKVKNNNGSTFDNGIIVYISGGESGFPTVSIAHNRDFTTVDAIGMLTHDVEAGTFGFLTTYGTVGGLDTSGETPGAIVYVDTLQSGKNWTTTIPEFSNFQYEIGFIHTVDAVEGKIFINPKGQVDDVMHNINNANILENFDFTASSNGTTITGTLESSDGKDYLTVRWSDGFAKISVPATITIPAGTDHNSQTAYIYIPKSTGVLTSSTSYFPIGTQYKTIAKTEAWSALRTQTNGLKGLQNYNDFIANTGSLRGRIAQIGNWQRLRNLKYINGSNGTVTVRPNGAASDTVTFAVTQGNWSQSNEQVLSAMDMFTGDSIYVLNYPDHPDTAIIDLNEILIDATGASLAGKSWTWVFWISQNKTGEPSFMWVNLPNGSYSSGEEAEEDVSQFKVTDIPYEMRSYSGFVTEAVMTHTNPSGGTWSIFSTTQVQGNEPGYSGGGGGDGGGGTFDSDTDTPASKAGSANKIVGVDLGEANLVYKDVTIDGSGNMDISGNLNITGIGILGISGQILNGSDTLVSGDAVFDYVGTNFVPYTGATTNVDLGSNNFTTTGSITGNSLNINSNASISSSGQIDTDNKIGINLFASNPDSKLQISFGAGGIAPTTITKANSYITLGETEFNVNSYRLIGFGYSPLGNIYSPAFIGYEEISSSGETRGDIIMGTRSVNTDTQPPINFRLNGDGDLTLGGTATAPKYQLNDINTYIDEDGSNNMTFTDAVTGTKTLAELGGLWTDNGTSIYPTGSEDVLIGTSTDAGTWKLQVTGALRTTSAYTMGELGSVSTPASGFGLWWANTSNRPSYTNDAGQIYDLTNASGYERANDPSTITSGYVIWQSNGAGSGDDGDIMIMINDGSTTKTITLVDFSAF